MLFGFRRLCCSAGYFMFSRRTISSIKRAIFSFGVRLLNYPAETCAVQTLLAKSTTTHNTFVENWCAPNQYYCTEHLSSVSLHLV